MITDLTGTSWYINNSLTITSAKEYDIVFESRGTTFELISMGSSYVDYDQTNVCYPGDEYGWRYQMYRAITISGGDDVSSQELISWLEDNAIQIVVDDLTNTSWTINDAPETMVGSGQYGQGTNLTFNIVGSDTEYSNFTWRERSQLSYRIGPAVDQNYLNVYNTSTGWVDSSYKTITITGGSEASLNFDRGWFQANAVPYVVEPNYIDKVILTSGDEYYLKDSISGYIAESDLVTGNNIQISATSEGVSISKVNSDQVRFRFIRYPKPSEPSLTDLTGTTWYFNDHLQSLTPIGLYDITFINNNHEYIKIGNSSTYPDDIWYRSSSGTTYAYEAGWILQSYRTINITGGTDSTNSGFIAWLEANATQVS